MTLFNIVCAVVAEAAIIFLHKLQQVYLNLFTFGSSLAPAIHQRRGHQNPHYLLLVPWTNRFKRDR